MHIRLLFAILLTGFLVQAQPGIDSLKRELTKREQSPSTLKNDTLHFRALVKLAGKTKDWEQARNYWQKAIELAEKRHWSQGRLEAYKGMGVHYRKKGSLMDAAQYFQRGLSLAESTHNLNYQSDTYQALGLAYGAAGDLAKSIQYHQNALKLIDKSDRKRLLNCLNEIGNAYYNAGKYGMALEHYQKCVSINKSPIDSTRQSWFLGNVAASYQHLNKPDSALQAYAELFKYGRFFIKEDSVVSYSRIAQAYLLVNKPDVALTNALVAYRIAFSLQNYYCRQLVSQVLSEAYQKKGNWQQAFFHEQHFRAYSDSIHFQEQRRKLENIKISYEGEKMRASLESRMQIQNQEHEISKIIVLFLGLLTAVLIFFNYVLRKRRKKIEYQKNEISKINDSLENRVQERTAELQLANSELIRKNREIEEALLKGQTLERKRVASELHDNLGGTLTAIQWYMESLLLSDAANNLKHEGYDDLYRMISRAYAEVRLLAHHMMPDALEKQGLEAALLELSNQINKAKRLQLSVDAKLVSPYLNSQQKFELYSIALELCTNIMKHAYASEAYVVLDKTDQEIVMSVTDNGVGMSDNQQKQSMGLKNIQSRLETIGGYCTLHSVKDQGTTVVIHIPYSQPGWKSGWKPGWQPELLEIMDHKHANS